MNFQGKVITVFGGTGFLGRYVVSRLARTGATIRIPSRSPQKAYFLKPSGNVGQIVAFSCDAKNEKDIQTAIAGSDIVINLIGILFEKGKSRFDAMHHQFAGNVARIAAKEGVSRLIHISAIGADEASACRYQKTKALGEKAVLKHFPNAVIIRPSIIFGAEDNFFNMFAKMAGVAPFLPLIGGGKTRFQPVYVGDVAHAVAEIAIRHDISAFTGKIIEAVGPTQYSFADLLRMTLRYSSRKAGLVPVPFALAKLKASILQLLPTPLLTRDQVEALRTDNIGSEHSLNLSDLDISPAAVEAIVPRYLARYAPYSKKSA